MEKLLSLYKKHQNTVFLIFSILVCLVPLTWFKGMPIAGEEYYALDYAKWGKLFSGSWFDAINWGEYSPLSSFKFQAAFFNILYFVGLSKYLSLVIWHLSLFIVSAIGIYVLLSKLYKDTVHPFYYFIATVLYIFTPFFLNISVFLSPPRIFLALLPYIFLVFLDIDTKKQLSFSHLFLLNMLLLLGSPIFVNIPLGLVFLACVYIGLIYFGFIQKLKWTVFITKLGLFTVIFFLLNIWWLLPTAYKQFNQSAGVKQEAASFVTTDKTLTVDALSLFGSWAFREKIANKDYFYFPYNKEYDQLPLSLIRYIPYILVAVAIFGLYTKEKSDKKKYPYLYFIVLLHTVFLFLAKGTAEPLGFVYSFLYKNFPLFWIYREPYAKFMPVVVLTSSILVVYSVTAVGQFIKEKEISKNYYYFIALVTFVSTVLLIKPFIVGEVVWNVNDGTTRSYRVDIPSDWLDIQKNWKPALGYYFQFPSTDIYDSYNWKSGYNGNPYLLLTNAKLLNPERGYSASENTERRYVTSYLFSDIISNPLKYITDSVRYDLAGLLLQKDTVYNNYKYAFAVIAEKYKDYLNFENPAVSVYSTNKNGENLISLAPFSKVINIEPLQMPYYHLIRGVTTDDRLVNVSSVSTSSFNLVNPQQGTGTNEVVYNLPSIKDNYSIYLVKNTENIQKVLLDNNVVNPIKGTYDEIQVKPTETCCTKLSITTKTNLLVGGSYPLTWSQQPAFSQDINNLTPVSDGFLRIAESTVYLAPITGFDPNLVNHIQLLIKGNYNYPVGLSIVQVDKESKSTRYISNYQLKDFSKPVTVTYNGITNPVPQLFKDSDYFIGIYGLRLVDDKNKVIPYPDDIAYTVPSAMSIQETFPFVYTINSPTSSQGTYDSNIEYHTITPSLTVAHLPNLSDSSVLQFKNSYSPEWRLIEINEAQYKKLSESSLSFGDQIHYYLQARKAASSYNIEYYSNGWVVSPTDAGKYYAFVFWPTLLQDLCFSISCVFFGVLVVIWGVLSFKLLSKVRLAR